MNKENKNFIRHKILGYKPDFDLEILEAGLAEFQVDYYKAGEFILQEGEVCKRIFMVENSITRCYYINGDGEEKTVWLEQKSSVITEFESFSSQTTSNCNIYCYEDSTVYSIDRQDLMKLYATYHDWALFGLLIMEEHYVSLLKFGNKLNFNTASENYDLIENHFSHYLDVVPLKHLASWLNISPVHLSRIRKEKGNISKINKC